MLTALPTFYQFQPTCFKLSACLQLIACLLGWGNWLGWAWGRYLTLCLTSSAVSKRDLSRKKKKKKKLVAFFLKLLPAAENWNLPGWWSSGHESAMNVHAKWTPRSNQTANKQLVVFHPTWYAKLALPHSSYSQLHQQHGSPVICYSSESPATRLAKESLMREGWGIWAKRWSRRVTLLGHSRFHT